MSSGVLLSHHREMLEASTISAEVIEARGYRSIEDRQELRDLGFTAAQSQVPGLLIPLRRMDGEPGGYQYRPDNPRESDGKTVKYESPKGQRNILDVPPTVRGELRRGRQAILITEGAKKADALASLGIPAINISGVYGWRGRNEDDGLTALSDWEDVALKGNIIVLAFDSDILTKHEVHQALSRLKRFLEHKGAARVRVLMLPNLMTGKTGVDDYIAEKGAALEDLASLIVDDLPAMNGHQPAKVVDVPPLGELLDAVEKSIRRYVFLSALQLIAVVLWVAHSHAFAVAETTPYMSIRSAEKRSGKSRLLEVVELLTPNSLKTENISVAALVHSVDKGATLLLDEVDSVFGRGRASDTQEALRGILDSGYRLTGSYVRMVGQGANMSPRRFNTFSPKMLSGIGKLPGTLDDRSIIVQMKRKTSDEKVERFRFRDARDELATIRDCLSAWAQSAVDELRDARPVIPEKLDDRAQDGWEPLLAIAELAGGTWPKRALNAALALSAGEAREDESLGVKLLADVKVTFESAGKDRLPTSKVLNGLNNIDDAPWGAFNDRKGMTARELGRMLKPYGVRSKTIRETDGSTPKGYNRADFTDAWLRYGDSAATSDTPDNDAADGEDLSATPPLLVADNHHPSTPVSSGAADVADESALQGEMLAKQGSLPEGQVEGFGEL